MPEITARAVPFYYPDDDTEYQLLRKLLDFRNGIVDIVADELDSSLGLHKGDTGDGADSALTKDDIEFFWSKVRPRYDKFAHDIGITVDANLFTHRSETLNERCNAITERVRRLAWHLGFPKGFRCYVWPKLGKAEFREFVL